MDQQKLPNVTIALVLGIISFLCCFCSSGLGGVLMSGIALFLTNKDAKTYAANPENYNNFSQLKTAKIIAIIGLVIALCSLAFAVYQIVSAGGWEAYTQQQLQILEDMGIELE